MTPRPVVVGGGICGAFAAYFLARHGMAPVLIDRGSPGRTSSANPGGLNPLHGPGIPGPLDELAMASFRLHLSHHEAIRELSATDFNFRRVKRLVLALDDERVRDRDDTIERYAVADGFDARWLDPHDVLTLEPRLDRRLEGGLLTNGNGRVDAPAYTRAVTRAAVALGAEPVTAEVGDLVTQGSRVTGVVTDGQHLPSTAVVIATGAGSSEPERWLGVPLPIAPVQGELLRARIEGDPLRCDLSWGSLGVYEMAGSEVLLGGTEMRGGLEARPTAAGRASILERTARLLPGARDPVVTEHVAGVRPVTPDHLPIAGRAPGWENAFLVMGGGRKGMLLAAGMGSAIADLIWNATTSVPIGVAAPDRFASQVGTRASV